MEELGVKNAIQIKNLTKDYKDFSLKQITMNIPEGCVMGLINMVFSLVLMLGYVYGGKTTDIQNGIFIWLAGSVISIVIWAFLYAVLRFVAPWEEILALGKWNLLGIAFLGAIPTIVLSYWGCLKIYEKKHS